MIVDNQRRTSQIVAAYVRKNLIPTDQIGGLIKSVHSTLSGLGNEVVEESPPVPAVSVRRSVRPDHIICMDCGYKGKMLKRHLQSKHELSAVQYRLRWSLSSDYPMTAPNYSEQRAQFAKKIGLGRTPAQPAPAPATEKPPRRRSASKTTRSRTSAKKANPKTSAKKAGSKTSASKASPKTSAKKASPKTSAKKDSSRPESRKPSSRVASKARSAPEAATA